MPQRLGLLLLGLLFLAGAVHGPMHQDGQDCGSFALCSGGAVLMLVAAAIVLQLFLELAGYRTANAPHGMRCFVPGQVSGRGPPQ